LNKTPRTCTNVSISTLFRATPHHCQSATENRQDVVGECSATRPIPVQPRWAPGRPAGLLPLALGYRANPRVDNAAWPEHQLAILLQCHRFHLPWKRAHRSSGAPVLGDIRSLARPAGRPVPRPYVSPNGGVLRTRVAPRSASAHTYPGHRWSRASSRPRAARPAAAIKWRRRPDPPCHGNQ